MEEKHEKNPAWNSINNQMSVSNTHIYKPKIWK